MYRYIGYKINYNVSVVLRIRNGAEDNIQGEREEVTRGWKI
jgi:hypothetical protein